MIALMALDQSMGVPFATAVRTPAIAAKTAAMPVIVVLGDLNTLVSFDEGEGEHEDCDQEDNVYCCFFRSEVKFHGSPEIPR